MALGEKNEAQKIFGICRASAHSDVVLHRCRRSLTSKRHVLQGEVGAAGRR
jgi:hypothetical protein